jgi:ABC-type Fe3+ transport system permease subunit
MNEVIVIAVWILAVVALIAITVRWFSKAYKNHEYINNKDYMFVDFYMLGKGTRVEDIW